MALNLCLFDNRPGYYGDPLANGCDCCTKLKVICVLSIINPKTYKHELTLNKIYDAIDMETQTHVRKTKTYNLIDDTGFRTSCDKSYFITLAEYRETQINEIFMD